MPSAAEASRSLRCNDVDYHSMRDASATLGMTAFLSYYYSYYFKSGSLNPSSALGSAISFSMSATVRGASAERFS